ncbi:MAG: Bcr/CflA family drug resistance efflux transporter [Desulfuromonas sp.]|nr:MAG: Bcr/CflA family drug resistance efflux transporter [Desulfuromonas sp.]
MSSFTATSSAPKAAPPPQNLLQIVLLLGALTAFGPLSIDMYLPAFPAIAHDLHIPLGTVQLSISAFLFGSAAGQLVYGPLADRWGRRLPLQIGISLYIASTLGCALAESGTALLFWRVVMAIGGGAGMVITRAIVRDLYDTTEAARIFSLLMLVMGSAPILAPMAGGQLLILTGWRGIFVNLGLFGLLVLFATTRFLPETLPQSARSYRGLKSQAGDYTALLRSRNYLRYALALASVSGITFAYIAGAPFFFIELNQITPQHFGLFFGANAFGLIGASQVNRRLLQRFNAQSILAVVFPLNAVIGALLLSIMASDFGGFPLQIILLFLGQSLTGLLYPNITALAMEPFKKMAGSASAMLGTIQYSLGAIAGAIVGLCHNGTALPMVAVIAGCGFFGWLTAAGICERGSASL